MSVYVIAPCFIESARSKMYITDVLLEFAKTNNNHRVGIDRDKLIIDRYHEIAVDNAGIASWLQLMSIEPCSFEEISDVDEAFRGTIELFLEVCKCVVPTKQMIVHTVQNFAGHNFIDERTIEYDGEHIRVIERGESVQEFWPVQQPKTIIKNSNVATGGSRISGVN